MSFVWLIFMIPIFGILAGAFQEWLKFKEKQQQLGSSTHELEQTVERQQEMLAEAQRRLQNLEAIVTSQMWDALHDDALPEPERQRALAEARLHLDDAAPEPSDAERAAQLARRLKL